MPQKTFEPIKQIAINSPIGDVTISLRKEINKSDNDNINFGTYLDILGLEIPEGVLTLQALYSHFNDMLSPESKSPVNSRAEYPESRLVRLVKGFRGLANFEQIAANYSEAHAIKLEEMAKQLKASLGDWAPTVKKLKGINLTDLCGMKDSHALVSPESLSVIFFGVALFLSKKPEITGLLKAVDAYRKGVETLTSWGQSGEITASPPIPSPG